MFRCLGNNIWFQHANRSAFNLLLEKVQITVHIALDTQVVKEINFFKIGENLEGFDSIVILLIHCKISTHHFSILCLLTKLMGEWRLIISWNRLLHLCLRLFLGILLFYWTSCCVSPQSFNIPAGNTVFNSSSNMVLLYFWKLLCVLSLHSISPTSLLFSRLDILFYFVFGILILFFPPSELLSICSFLSEIMASTDEYTVIGCSLMPLIWIPCLLLMDCRIVLVYLPAESHCGLLLNLKSSRTKQKQNQEAQVFPQNLLLSYSFPALGLCY